MADHAYERVLAMIVSGQIGVGERLPPELTLSRELGMSRPVLRQALRLLREHGVIVSRQGSGSFVRRRPHQALLDFAPAGSIADVQRTFEFRAAIEPDAAFLAATRRGAGDLVRLRDALAELDRCIETGELGTDADEAFHSAICIAADNSYFEAARASVNAKIIAGMNLNRSLSLASPRSRMATVQREHYAIFSAIERGDGPAARDAMREHVDAARRRVFAGARPEVEDA